MTGILSTESSRLGEAVLLRWLESHGPLSEAQVLAVTLEKQKALAEFPAFDSVCDADERQNLSRLFAQRFRELADQAIAIGPH